MTREYEIREGTETVRSRGVSVPSRVLAVALCLSMLISCIPVNMYGQKQEADALVPVAVGVGAAAATALGITETELILGIMAFLGAGVAMQISFDDMYASIDASTGEVDLEDYQTNYVDWKSKGVDLPSWGELGASEQSEWGWAWKYDEAIWIAYWMKFVGLNPLGEPNNPNNSPNDNKKWNLAKILGTTAGGTAAAELGLWGATNFLNSLWDMDGIGLLAINEQYINGHLCPWVVFQGEFKTANQQKAITYDSWYIGCKEYVYQGNEVNRIRIAFMSTTNNNWESNAKTFNIRETSSNNETYWVYDGESQPGWFGAPSYDYDTGTWTNISGGSLSPNFDYKLGHNLTYSGSNIWTDYYYFLNPSWYGGYRFVNENGDVIQPVANDNIQYGQYSDYPQEQASNLFNDDGYSWNQFWQNMESDDPSKTVTVSNPYYRGIYNPTWEDYFQERNSQDVNPVPDTTPDTEPLPDSGTGEDSGPDYGQRLENIADLAFSQVFPFCLINDIKRLSDRIVLTASAEPDFSVTLPLSDFGVEGMESITLDANYADTGGGLIDIGDYTRPIFTVLFIALLLGFSIKLFLR